MEEIKFGKYVELAYTVSTINNDNTEELMHEFKETAPDRFVYGIEQGMIESFANRIKGLKKGENFDFTLSPAEAFGEDNPDLIMTLDKKIFVGPDGKFDAETVKVNSVIPMMTQDGHRVQGIVINITDLSVVMDFNHPLAGESVRYVGKVLEVRDATEEERNPASCGGCGGCGSNGGGCGSNGGCNGCSGGCQ